MPHGRVSDGICLANPSPSPSNTGTWKNTARQDIGRFKNTSRPSSGSESSHVFTAPGCLEKYHIDTNAAANKTAPAHRHGTPKESAPLQPKTAYAAKASSPAIPITASL